MTFPQAITDVPHGGPLPRRRLGRTGFEATIFGLGGEGVLRTHGRMAEAVGVIHRALAQGVNYFDSAPAYAGCLDYLGAGLEGRRGDVFLASKTHERTRDRSLRLLEQTLKRLRTDYLDLWQLHDLRTRDDLERIFGRDGAIHALTEAKEEGRVRFLGITGHHDPSILTEAIGRFEFDTVLVALNAADVHRLSFSRTVRPEAARLGMGVIAMKVLSQGAILGPGRLTAEEAIGYVLSLAGVSLAIVGCSTPAEVDHNAQIARRFAPFAESRLMELETRTRTGESRLTYYKSE